MSDMTPEQIDAALKAGIIDAQQAERMRRQWGLPDRDDRDARSAVIGNEDHMRFVRSFSDVFIAIGIGLFCFGLSVFAIMLGGGASFLGAAAVAWLMAEYFGRKKRAHLPTLICALAFLVFIFRGSAAILAERLGLDGGILVAVTTLLAMIAFYIRIRLPFCMALIAVSALFLFFTLISGLFGSAFQRMIGIWFMLGGLSIFAVALWYDTQDMHRTTRFADNAFWLHFTAAPFIIHGLVVQILSLKTEKIFNVVPLVYLEAADAWMMMGIVIIVALIALAINRRALLVSSLGYAGFAIGMLIKETGADIGMIIALTLLVLGGAIMFLGVGWHTARNQLVKVLPDWKIFPPPYDPDYADKISA